MTSVGIAVENHSSDASMELAIGSDFACTTYVSQQNLAEVDMEARALFKSAVVHLMQGIQGASLKIVNRVRSRTKLFVRVKAISATHARLWAVLDMRDLTEEERHQMREFASSVTSEMYEPTSRNKVSEFQSLIVGDQMPDLADENGIQGSQESEENAISVRYRAITKAAQQTLPSHLQQVVASCGPEADPIEIAKAVQRVVDKGQTLAEEMSKQKEWTGLELRYGEDPLMHRDDLPKTQELQTVIDELPIQDAWVTKLFLATYSIGLHLLVDDIEVEVKYNDAEHGNSIGEAFVAAHRANQQQAEGTTEGVKLPRVRVTLTRETTGKKKTYTLRSLQPL